MTPKIGYYGRVIFNTGTRTSLVLVLVMIDRKDQSVNARVVLSSRVDRKSCNGNMSVDDDVDGSGEREAAVGGGASWDTDGMFSFSSWDQRR